MARRAATAHGPRARQRQTAISALATGIRYAILIAAAIAIAVALAGGGNMGAVGGGALVVIVIGFASQRLLFDVIAGFFILFEDQYGVGDVVRLEPSGYTGRVDSLGLRTTVLLGPGAERMIVPERPDHRRPPLPRGPAPLPARAPHPRPGRDSRPSWPSWPEASPAAAVRGRPAPGWSAGSGTGASPA